MPSLFKKVLGSNKSSPTSDKAPQSPQRQGRSQSLPLQQTQQTAQQSPQQYSPRPGTVLSPSSSYYGTQSTPYTGRFSPNSPPSGYSQYAAQYAANYPPPGAYVHQFSPPINRQSYAGSYSPQPSPWGGPQSPPVAPLPEQRPPSEIFETHADAHATRQDYNSAVVMYNQALMYAPNSAPLFCKRSYAHMLSTPPNFDAAMDDASAAIQLAPTFWRGWMQQGLVRLKNGNVQGAADSFGVAVDFATGDDKLTAQRSLADAQARLAQSPPLPQPTPESEHNDQRDLSSPQDETTNQPPSRPLSQPPTLPPLPPLQTSPIMSSEFSSPPVIQQPTPQASQPSALSQGPQQPLYSPATRQLPPQTAPASTAQQQSPQLPEKLPLQQLPQISLRQPAETLPAAAFRQQSPQSPEGQSVQQLQQHPPPKPAETLPAAAFQQQSPQSTQAPEGRPIQQPQQQSTVPHAETLPAVAFRQRSPQSPEGQPVQQLQQLSPRSPAEVLPAAVFRQQSPQSPQSPEDQPIHQPHQLTPRSPAEVLPATVFRQQLPQSPEGQPVQQSQQHSANTPTETLPATTYRQQSPQLASEAQPVQQLQLLSPRTPAKTLPATALRQPSPQSLEAQPVQQLPPQTPHTSAEILQATALRLQPTQSAEGRLVQQLQQQSPHPPDAMISPLQSPQAPQRQTMQPFQQRSIPPSPANQVPQPFSPIQQQIKSPLSSQSPSATLPASTTSGPDTASIPAMHSQHRISLHPHSPSPQISGDQSPIPSITSPQTNRTSSSPLNSAAPSWLSSKSSSTASARDSIGEKSLSTATKMPPMQAIPSPSQRRTMIPRSHNASSVSKSAVSNLPFGLDEVLGAVASSIAASTNPSFATMSPDMLEAQLGQLQDALAIKNRGSLSIRPYTGSGNIDAIRLFYVGLTQTQLTSREIRPPVYQHPSFYAQAVDSMNYPGNTFLDMDCESSAYYEGRLPGTIGISGYSEEYREHQLLLSPIPNFALEGQNTLPVVPLDTIVEKIRSLLVSPNQEDNEGLQEILGLSELGGLRDGIDQDGPNRQRVIESICLTMNRNIFDHPSRFVDLSKARNVSNHTLGGLTQGVGLHNFLHEILIGAELLIRLRKEPPTTSYAGLVTDSISALIVLVDLWMQNVAINGPNPAPPGHPMRPFQIPYTLYSRVHQRQAEGLVRFAELLQWPYMEEAQNYMRQAYTDLTSGKPIGYDICDWLFGLVLPGKIFRHRIMCCLVYASPTIRSINAALYFDEGLVVKDKSYWPKRTVLGRVLGACKDAKSVCGWIGPVLAPAGNLNGWIRVAARRVDCPTPCDPNQNSLEVLGFDRPGPQDTAEIIVTNITDPSEWVQASPSPRPFNDRSRSILKEIQLTEVSLTNNTGAKPTAASTGKDYRATLLFDVNGKETTYTLNTNPLFICPHPCVGVHTLHRRQVQTYLSSTVRVGDLKNVNPPANQFLLIDATGEGEEVVARAWCSERGRHAVVRKGSDTCFACAAMMASTKSGLGFNVLIWSN